MTQAYLFNTSYCSCTSSLVQYIILFMHIITGSTHHTVHAHHHLFNTSFCSCTSSLELYDISYLLLEGASCSISLQTLSVPSVGTPSTISINSSIAGNGLGLDLLLQRSYLTRTADNKNDMLGNKNINRK